jgi:hypothetical protein
MAQRATLRASATLPDTGGMAPIGTLPFLGVVVASFGGPLALAALYAPSILADASASAGFVMVAAAVVFAVPLLVWVRYARHVASPGAAAHGGGVLAELYEIPARAVGVDAGFARRPRGSGDAQPWNPLLRRGSSSVPDIVRYSVSHLNALCPQPRAAVAARSR